MRRDQDDEYSRYARQHMSDLEAEYNTRYGKLSRNPNEGDIRERIDEETENKERIEKSFRKVGLLDTNHTNSTNDINNKKKPDKLTGTSEEEKRKEFLIKAGKFLFFTWLAFFIGWNLLCLLISPINRILGFPNVKELAENGLVSSIEVYDRNEQLVCVLQGKEDRQIVPLDQIATPVKQALLAAEDKDFYKHKGISLWSISRAVVANLKKGDVRQGGSTITQQLVKNVFFSLKDWKSIKRKVKEFFLSIEVEKKYSKDQILEMYLNKVFWGKGAYGIQRAAQRYFNKNAAELNIAEASYLVSLISSPSTLHGTERALKIQRQVISNMVKYGYITKEQAQEALNYKLKFESAPGNLSKYPFFMSVVLEELGSRYSEQEIASGGFKVYTTIDPKAQEKAEEILAKRIKLAPPGVEQGALVTVDVASGEVRAIVGGVGDFWDHQWNRATSAHTMGSSFKPFVYLAAFMNGICSSETKVLDTPFVYEQPETGEIWEPRNYDGKFWGEMTVRRALINSRNIPAIRIAEKTTMKSVIETAKLVGLNNVQPWLPSALGSSAESPLNVANAYSTIARGGIQIKPIMISKIYDKNGKLLEQNTSVPERVLPAYPVYELIDIMKDVVRMGTGTQANIPELEIAGKTGTTDGARDVWFIGFTPDTVTVLWGGNDHNQEVRYSATGGVIMAPVWKEYMLEYYKINPMPKSYFPKPAAKIRVLVDRISGLKATKDTPEYLTEWREIVPGTEPKAYAPKPTEEKIQKYFEEKERELKYIPSDEQDEDARGDERSNDENSGRNSNENLRTSPYGENNQESQPEVTGYRRPRRNPYSAGTGESQAPSFPQQPPLTEPIQQQPNTGGQIPPSQQLSPYSTNTNTSSPVIERPRQIIRNDGVSPEAVPNVDPEQPRRFSPFKRLKERIRN